MPAHHTSRSLGRDDVYVIRTLDGSDTLFSRTFNATYHSINGAVSESRHVFIRHGLMLLMSLPEVRILEIGFGTGLNAFLAFLISQKFTKPIFYVGVESHPIDQHVAAQLNYPSYLNATGKESLFLKMHNEDAFSSEHFHFRKCPHLDQVEAHHPFDCIFFDGFSPAEQPEIWDLAIFEQLYKLTSVGGYLVTYCAQGEVRRKMERAGYKVNRLPGAPGKREMIQAIRL